MELSTLFELHPGLLALVACLFGMTVGSFLNVVIYRLPVMMERDWREQCHDLLAEGDAPNARENEKQEPAFNLMTPRSACPQCKAPIAAWQNIPILSYLLLRGRCANCRTRISIRYPLVELFSGLVSALVAWQFGFTIECLMALGLTWSLIALSGIDIDHQYLPDSITLPLLWVGLLMSLYHGGQAKVLFISPTDAIVGGAAGYLSLWSVYQAYRLLTKKEAMGYGDFKLLGALGAWLGWKMLPMIILLSSMVGAIVGLTMIVFAGRDRQTPIPFGPYLAAAGWIAMLWGNEILAVYYRVSGL